MSCRFAQRLAANTRGSVFVEYLVVASVMVLVTIALARIGPRVVRGYAAQQENLYRSHP
jgi:hypothetical protein